MKPVEKQTIASMLLLMQDNDSIIWAMVSDQFGSIQCKHTLNLSSHPRRCFNLLLFFYLLGRDSIGVTKKVWVERVISPGLAYFWLLSAGLIEKTELKNHYRISNKGFRFVNYCLADILDYSAKKTQIKAVKKPNLGITTSKKKLNILTSHIIN